MLGALPYFLAQEPFQAPPLLCLKQVWNQPARQGKWCLEIKTQTLEVPIVTVTSLLLGYPGEQGSETLALIGGDKGGRREEGCVRKRSRRQVVTEKHTRVHMQTRMCT